jgi:hypothetical protein
MKIQTGVEEEEDDSNDDDDDRKEYYYDEYNDEVHYGERYRDVVRRDDNGHETDFQGSLLSISESTNDRNHEVRIQTNIGSNNLKKHWFVSFDDRVLKPLFTRNDRDFRQLDHRSSHNRWDNDERRHENEDDFVGLIRGSITSLRNSVRNNNSTPYRDEGINLNNKNNQRTDFTNNNQGNNNTGSSSQSFGNSSSSIQQQNLGNTTNSLQSFPDLNSLLIDENKNELNENLLDLK